MIRAGVATADITPPAGSLMAAFPRGPQRRPRRAEGVHDSLHARVLCLSDGHQQIALCAADVAMFDQTDVERIRHGAGQTVPDLCGPRLILAGSHTHSGPETTYMFGNTEDDPWIREMNVRIVDAVVKAHAAMQPVRLRAARGRAELAHNRRATDSNGKSIMVFNHHPEVTTGPTDPDLPVLCLNTKDGRALAIVYNFAAHALTIGPNNLLFTADFPGVASARIEARYPGCTALFLNGAAGNQHPRRSMGNDFAVTEEIGAALAERVLQATACADAVEDPDLAFLSEYLTFPHRLHPGRQVDVELSCFRLGRVLAAVVPGEPFIEFQLAFKRALASKIGMFVGYANGSRGYIPTRAAFQDGGYGVAAHKGDPPGRCRTALPTGAGEAILERLLHMAARLSDGVQS